MLAVFAGGICPGARLLFEELKRSGLDLLELNEQVNDLSSVVVSPRELQKRIDEAHRRYHLEGLLFVGNDELMKVAYGLCSAGFRVAYVPSADASLTWQGLEFRTIVNHFVRMATLARSMKGLRRIKIVLPKSLKTHLSRFEPLFEVYEDQKNLFLVIQGEQRGESTIKLESFLNCLEADERDRECIAKLAWKISEAFTNWRKVHHVFQCEVEPIPISQAYELWKKVRESEGEPSVREMGDQEH
ncbi:MAG: hypothetical protein AB7S45_05865 [Pseudothermotoga sp.]